METWSEPNQFYKEIRVTTALIKRGTHKNVIRLNKLTWCNRKAECKPSVEIVNIKALALSDCTKRG